MFVRALPMTNRGRRAMRCALALRFRVLQRFDNEPRRRIRISSRFRNPVESTAGAAFAVVVEGLDYGVLAAVAG